MKGQDLLHLADILDLPDEVFTRGNYRFDHVEAFALTCARLSSANNEHDLCTQYDRSQSSISKIFNEVVVFLNER
jgi:predicted site-specific integrase-resolvase